uniref:Cell division protein FtsX n=2 Tax=Candidatus Bipolaricaulota TaxID=67810 RepID=H5S8K6_9BACT|nr:hypothetical protein HGMM_F01E02C35 [uncultured Acetothermia bacterium]BAL52617.1 hypothetical protein HGMM_F01H03C19 [uncultured Acetothermia bacterium]BAL59624.1 hypothetical protein HGMM_OP4C260 [Candidatus Acetothermum autotrophicum]
MNTFLVVELLRTLVTRWRLLVWGLGALVLMAVSFGLFAVVTLASGEWGENRLIVLFDPGVSSEQIRQVYRQVREWEAISEVFYIPKDDPRYAQDGVESARAPAGYLRVTVRQVSDTREAEAALRDLPGVASVQTYQKGALRALITSEASAHAGATGLKVGSVFASVVVLVVLLRVLAQAWRGELEILYLSGLPPRAIRWAFVSVAVLWALGAGVVAIVISVSARTASAVQYWLPELLQPGSVWYVSMWVLGVALLVGIGAGLVGALGIRGR